MTSERVYALKLTDTGAARFEWTDSDGTRRVFTSTEPAPSPGEVRASVTDVGKRKDVVFETSPDNGTTWDRLGAAVVV